MEGLLKGKCTQASCTPHPHTYPQPHAHPPLPRRAKSSSANLFIANHSPWKLQILDFIWHWSRWEASGSQRDKANLGKAEQCGLVLGSSNARGLTARGVPRLGPAAHWDAPSHWVATATLQLCAHTGKGSRGGKHSVRVHHGAGAWPGHLLNLLGHCSQGHHSGCCCFHPTPVLSPGLGGCAQGAMEKSRYLHTWFWDIREGLT